jgi:peroxiredoxin
MVEDYNSDPNFGLPSGTLAPAFTLSDTDGQPVEFNPSSVQQPVLLNFFRGSW